MATVSFDTSALTAQIPQMNEQQLMNLIAFFRSILNATPPATYTFQPYLGISVTITLTASEVTTIQGWISQAKTQAQTSITNA